MKKLFLATLLLCALAFLSATFTGCNTASQRTAYNTIFTIEQTATVAVDDYYTLVLKGQLSTNGVPQVSKAYNDLQASVNLAIAVSQSGTNALAPANLVIEASKLGALISQLKLQK